MPRLDSDVPSTTGAVFEFGGSLLTTIDGSAATLQLRGVEVEAKVLATGELQLTTARQTDNRTECYHAAVKALMNELKRRQEDVKVVEAEIKSLIEQGTTSGNFTPDNTSAHEELIAMVSLKTSHLKRIHELKLMNTVSVRFQATHIGSSVLLPPGVGVKPSWLPLPIMWCPDTESKAPTTTTTESEDMGICLRETSSALYVLGGETEPASDSCAVDRWDPKTGAWENVSQMPESRTTPAVECLGEHVYVFGGGDERGCPSNSAWRWDPATNVWKPCASMLVKRASCGGAVLGNQIYAIGGWDGVNALASVERYDPRTDVWSLISPLNLKRFGCAVSANGAIYAMGGLSSAGNFLSSVERFDLQTQAWTQVAPLPYACSPHTTAWAGQIFAISTLGTCRYDPKKDSWEHLQLPTSSIGGAIAAWDSTGVLYSCGGKAESKISNRCVQIKLPLTGGRTGMTSHLRMPRYNHCLIVAPA